MPDSHTPEWHLLDCSFAQADAGLPLPVRNLSAAGMMLQIQNLDRSDPPGYRAGSMPRGAFNRNVINIASSACMPSIPVACMASGFDPVTNPIQWRLVCRHILCRYCNVGGYQYKSAFDVFEREWRGQTRAAKFSIFGNDSPDSSCTYSDGSHLMGGHAILQVAVAVRGAVLRDFVHLRIGAFNPTPADVMKYLEQQLAGADPNVTSMILAIFAHEAGYRQFNMAPQSQASMTFSYTRGFHRDPAQPDCKVSFAWPADPPNFPNVAFDYGVGISQYTRVGNQTISSDMAWDWRENVRTGINLFLTSKLRPQLKAGMSWREWARAAWAAYNGAGEAAQKYAQQLAASPDGMKVSGEQVPTSFQIAMLRAPAALSEPGPWMPESSSAVAV